MSGRRLLREWYALDPAEVKSSLVKESRDANGGKLILKGVIQKAETKNQNGRVYPRQILNREVENYMKAVKEGRATGELDHPESATVSLKNVSHVLREVWWEGNDVVGRVEVLSTPSGKILESLLESGVTVGISSRGVGSTQTNESGSDVVQPDFTIVCWDMVSEPSTPGAYMMSENREIEFDRRKVFTKADRIYRAVNAIVLGRDQK